MLLINKQHIRFYQAVPEPTLATLPDTGLVKAQASLAVADAK